MDWLQDGCDALQRITDSLLFVDGRPVPLEVLDALAEFMETPFTALGTKEPTSQP